MNDVLNVPPGRVLLLALVVVLCSSIFLSAVTGYGTVLSQSLILGGWGIVAALTSPETADAHRAWALLAASVLNAFTFLVPALAIWLLFKSRKSIYGASTMVAWLLLYLACVFLLFPASDGP